MTELRDFFQAFEITVYLAIVVTVVALPTPVFAIKKTRMTFETVAVHGSIADPPPEKFLLVDDIVTRGATLFGAANRLLEAFPKAQVRAFAAMRTVSVPSKFENMYDPQSGTTQYRAWIDDTLRRP